jgi:hypothetical protein
MGVGRTVADDSATAGREAVTVALAGREPALVMVFSSRTYDHAALLEAVRGCVPPSTAIVGCTTDGQMAGPGLDLHGGNVRSGAVAVAVGGPGFEVRTHVVRDASARRREAGIEAAGAMATIQRPYGVCVMFSDGLTGEQHEIVRGAYSVLGAIVPVVGGCSGDDLRYECTYQFHGDGDGVEILTDAVIAIGLGSNAPFGVGIAHGWAKHGDPMVVTASSGGRVFTLDNEPALDVYLRRIGGDRSLVDTSTPSGRRFQNPLGLSRRTGEDIRVVHGADPADGSLMCLADVPQGALTWAMTTDPDSLVTAAAESCSQAVSMLEGARPIGLVTFDCGARKIMLGEDGVRREIGAIGEAVGGAPFGGFYTYGEMARTQGARGMHHLTVVALAVA